MLIDFISQNPAHLRVDPSTVEPGTVCPNPASWHRVDECLNHMSMRPSDVAGSPNPEGMYALSMGLVGTEAAIAFCAFVKDYEIQISAEDVLAGNLKKQEIKKIAVSMLNNVIDKIADHSKENSWTNKQCENVDVFARSVSGEMMVVLWNKIAAGGNIENIQKMHKLLGQEVVKAVQASRNL